MINYASPTFVSLVLWVLYVLLALALGLTAWSVLRGTRLQGRLPHGRLPWAVAALVVLTMGASWLAASTEPLRVNGKTYDNVFWLRTSDMLIGTSAVLMAVAVALVVIGYFRKKR